MVSASKKQFEEIAADCIEKVPSPYKERLKNVAFLIEDEPSTTQRERMRLGHGQTLLGLYEGVPLPERGGVEKLLPDKITLFRLPLLSASQDIEELRENIRRTIWHEVAHYFGLDHKRIHELEK